MNRHFVPLALVLTFALSCGDDATEGGVNNDANNDVNNGSTNNVLGNNSTNNVENNDTPNNDTPNNETNNDVCVPQCTDRRCGEDGCGGVCGTCGASEGCEAGACVALDCAPGCTQGCAQGCFDLGECAGEGLDVHANLQTIGVVASPGGAQEAGELYYRQQGASTWWKGHPLARLPDGRLAGSVFGTGSELTYELRVEVDGQTHCATTTTQSTSPEADVAETLYVEAGSAAGDGSQGAPFGTIQAAVDAASGQTDIIIRPGVYRESVSIDARAPAGGWLRLLGEPGAVLDGSDAAAYEGLTWTSVQDGVWSTPWSGAPSYLNRDGVRLYHYITLDGLMSGVGDDGEAIEEGWFVEGGQLYVRASADPNNDVWQLPSLGTAIALDGAEGVWLKGLEVRFYGEGEYPKGIDVRASDRVIIEGNHLWATPSPIWVRRGSNDVRVVDNLIHQTNVTSWPWPAVKGTDHENTAIQLSGGRGAIVYGNRIHTIFNGIGSGSFGDDQNTELAFDVDVYDNRLFDISDDGLDPEGACINNRYRNNKVDTMHNGISLAPITFGPVWVLRNRLTDYAAGGIKLSNDSSGRVWLLHNTSFTDRPETNGLTPSGYFENMVFRNNIIRGTRYALEMSRASGPNDLDYDNLYSPRGAPLIKWNDVRQDDLAAWCAADGYECNGSAADPMLEAPAEGRFAPMSGSPNVDAALRLYGINDDFEGEGPDVGYIESGREEVPVLVP